MAVYWGVEKVFFVPVLVYYVDVVLVGLVMAVFGDDWVVVAVYGDIAVVVTTMAVYWGVEKVFFVPVVVYDVDVVIVGVVMVMIVMLFVSLVLAMFAGCFC